MQGAGGCESLFVTPKFGEGSVIVYNIVKKNEEIYYMKWARGNCMLKRSITARPRVCPLYVPDTCYYYSLFGGRPTGCSLTCFWSADFGASRAQTGPCYRQVPR